jgi:hypothetical protein
MKPNDGILPCSSDVFCQWYVTFFRRRFGHRNRMHPDNGCQTLTCRVINSTIQTASRKCQYIATYCTPGWKREE